MRVIALILLVGLVVVLPPVLVAAASGPRDPTGPVLVVHAPWTDGTALTRQAGGWPIGPRSAPLGILAAAPDAEGFAQRLRQAGAWIVLDAARVALFCTTTADRIADTAFGQTGRKQTS